MKRSCRSGKKSRKQMQKQSKSRKPKMKRVLQKKEKKQENAAKQNDLNWSERPLRLRQSASV